MTKYINSGIEWIGKIPEGWEIRKLKFILNFNVGGTPSTNNMEYFNGDNIWLCISDLLGKKVNKSVKMITNKAVKCSGLNKVKKGSLLYSFKLSIGNVAFSECDLYTNEAIASFSSENNDNLEFWYYILPLFIEKNANENIYGAKILNQFSIKNAFLINPPLPDKQKIVAFLDTKTEAIDYFIKNKQKIIELLEEEKKTIITNSVTKGINPDVNYKNSGIEWIGDIPEHWNVRRTKFLAKINPSKGEEKISKYSNDIISFLPMEKVSTNGNVDYSLQKNIKEVWEGFTYFKKNDIVIAKITPCFENGKGALLDSMPTIYGFGTTEFHVIRCNSILEDEYYYSITRTYFLRELGIFHMSGSAGQQRIPSSFISNYFVPLPPLKEQQQIVTYIEQESKKIDNLKEKYKKEINIIKEYKEKLIYDVVTGKINVQDYEIH